MLIILAGVFGLLIGWVGSLLMRTATSEGILIDMLAGWLGATAAALFLASSSAFDNIVAGYLGAMAAVFVLFLARRRGRTQP